MPFSHQVFYNQTIFNLTPTKILGNFNGGSFTSGVSAGWASSPASLSSVTFTSASTNTNVTNLSATVSNPSIAPTITTTDGGTTLTETAATTFKPLAAGQTLTIAGLTFTAGTSGATAAQVATAFQSIAVNTAAAAINTVKTLNDAAGGTFTSGTSASWSSGTATGAAVTFTSTTANSNVTNLASTVAAATNSPGIVTVEGVNGVSTETAALTFKPLVPGQTLTIAGLTFTAGTSGATAAQVATAFQSIAVNTTAAAINTAKTLNDAAGGTFTSGTSADWSSGAAGGAGGAVVTLTSTTANSNVTNLTSTISQVDSTPTIVTTDGSALASTETAVVTFSAMSAGQTITVAGLTYTAGTSGATANQVASAFGNLAVGATPSQANNTPFMFASSYVVTPGVWTTSTSLSGYIDKPGDSTSYTFLATGTFTVASANANTTISAVKGTITTLKIFADGALTEQINYGAGISTLNFGVTNSSVTPITTTIINTQRAEAVLQQDSIFRLINDGGGTFIGSTATTGGADQMLGGTSKDTFTGNTGNDYIDGGSGIDTAIYRGPKSQYLIGSTITIDRTDPLALNRVQARTVTDTSGLLPGQAARDDTDILVNVERLQFADTKVALDLAPTQAAGQAALLLGAVLPGQSAFDGTQKALIGLGISLFEQNLTMAQLSAALLRLPIWDNLTGVTGATTENIASYLVNNVYGNAKTPLLTTTAINVMTNESGASIGNYLATLAASTANQINIDLVGKQATGLEYLGAT